MGQVATYERLKTVENYKTIGPKWGHGCLCSFTRGSDYRDLTGKILVFWIVGGCLQEVVVYGGLCFSKKLCSYDLEEEKF